MKTYPLTCVLCGKVAVLGEHFVMLMTGPAHKRCLKRDFPQC